MIRCETCNRTIAMGDPYYTLAPAMALSIPLSWTFCCLDCLIEKAWEWRSSQPKLSKSTS